MDRPLPHEAGADPLERSRSPRTADASPPEHGADERAYRRLADHMPDFVVCWDTTLTRTYVNPAWVRASGFAASDVVGVPWEQLPPAHRPADERYLQALREVLANGIPQRVEFEWENARGERMVLDYMVVPERGDGNQVVGLLAVGRDVTERRRAEVSLRRLNRELAAVTNCSQALIRAEDEQSLLDEVCRIICEEAGYALAWVGVPEADERKTIRQVARAGREQDFLDTGQITWGDGSGGQGPAGVALRSGRTACIDVLADSPVDPPWRDAALARGLHALIGLPLRQPDGTAIGVLCIYAGEPGVFTPDEVRLLEDLAGDLAFGISVLRARQALRGAGLERLEHLQLLEALDLVNRALQSPGGLDDALLAALDALLAVFGCDRAFLLVPCDPNAPTWQVPYERTRPEWPGAFAERAVIPMGPDVAATFRALLAADGPVTFGPGTEHPLPADAAERYGFRSFLSMAVRPRIGPPWQLGLHQCTHVRQWTEHERRLLLEIGRRLEDGLTNLLTRQRLAESESRYREVFQSSPAALCEQDWSGIRQVMRELAERGVLDLEEHLERDPELLERCARGMRVVDANRALLAVIEATSVEEVATRFGETWTPELDETLRRTLGCLWRGGTSRSEESMLRALSGELRSMVVAFTVSPGSEDSLDRVIVSLEDVTERRRAEEEQRRLRDQLTQAQKMEAVGRLAGGMAHDFNNLLTVFSGYADLIHTATTDPTLREHAEVLAEASRRASSLTQSLLAFSRKKSLALVSVDLNDLLRHVGTLLRRFIGEDIDLRIRCDRPRLVVHADRGQLEQMLINLAVNSRDAMPGGGVLEVRLDAIALGEPEVRAGEIAAPGPYARIAVTDTGCGMDRETLEHVFEPFFTTKDVGHGTGLGLSILYGIVKQHRGTLRVESEPGRGTTFEIMLPLATDGVPADAQRPETPRGGTETLLLVEDDATLRRVVRLVLERAGYTVLDAADGLAALEVFARNRERIALVLTDVVMPRMNGRDLRERLRSAAPHLPLLMMSGYTADVAIACTDRAQDLPLVPKPLDFDELLHRIRSALDAAPRHDLAPAG